MNFVIVQILIAVVTAGPLLFFQLILWNMGQKSVRRNLSLAESHKMQNGNDCQGAAYYEKEALKERKDNFVHLAVMLPVILIMSVLLWIYGPSYSNTASLEMNLELLMFELENVDDK